MEFGIQIARDYEILKNVVWPFENTFLKLDTSGIG